MQEEENHPERERELERREERAEQQNQFNQKPLLLSGILLLVLAALQPPSPPRPFYSDTSPTQHKHTYTHAETDTGTVWSVEAAERDSPMSQHLPTIQHLPVPVTQGCKSFDTLRHTLFLFLVVLAFLRTFAPVKFAEPAYFCLFYQCSLRTEHITLFFFESLFTSFS